MRNFFSKYKGAIGVLLIILLGYWAYATLFPRAQEFLDDVPQPVGEELFEVLDVLEGISLDGEIFTDPNFLTLQDFETQVPSGFAGRVNPFAPIGGDAGGQLVEPSYIVIPISSAESFIDTSSGTSTPEETTAEESNTGDSASVPAEPTLPEEPSGSEGGSTSGNSF